MTSNIEGPRSSTSFETRTNTVAHMRYSPAFLVRLPQRGDAALPGPRRLHRHPRRDPRAGGRRRGVPDPRHRAAGQPGRGRLGGSGAGRRSCPERDASSSGGPGPWRAPASGSTRERVAPSASETSHATAAARRPSSSARASSIRTVRHGQAQRTDDHAGVVEHGAATARIPGVRSASDPAQPRCLAVASSAASAVGSVTVRSVTASIPRGQGGLLPRPRERGQHGLAGGAVGEGDRDADVGVVAAQLLAALDLVDHRCARRSAAARAGPTVSSTSSRSVDHVRSGPPPAGWRGTAPDSAELHQQRPRAGSACRRSWSSSRFGRHRRQQSVRGAGGEARRTGDVADPEGRAAGVEAAQDRDRAVDRLHPRCAR